MANRKVYTGNPVGTYEYGDKHPRLDLYFMAYYGKYERWADFGTFQSSYKYHHKIDVARRKPKNKSQNMQTGSTVGTYSRGDPHPRVKGRYFSQYCHGKERWMTKEQLERKRVQNIRSVRKTSPYVKMEEHVKAEREDARERVWDIYRDEKAYNKMYWAYGRRIDHHWKHPDEIKAIRAKRRKAYRKNNPAKRVEERRARKRKIKKSWHRLSDAEKAMSNLKYKWRDMLNGLHEDMVFVVDHVKPLAKGGTCHPDNLQVTTYKYNEWKLDRDVSVDEFYKTA